MIALEVFKKKLEENGDKFPLLTLDEFFDGNSEEDSKSVLKHFGGRIAIISFL